MYYFFACTTKELRDKHYSEFLDVYYESLSEFISRLDLCFTFLVVHLTLKSFLGRLGSDPNKVFPRNVFEDHLKRFGNFGLTMAVMVLPIFTSDPEDVPDLDAVADNLKTAQDNGEEKQMEVMSFSSPKTIGDYTRKMTGVFQDMCRLGYI